MKYGRDTNNNKLKTLYQMYKIQRPEKTGIKLMQAYVGERIEEKIERIVNNNEPITDGAPLVYTERKDGVKPEMDIRTDRWDLALDAMTYGAKSHIAKREAKIVEMNKKDGEPKSTGDDSVK